MHLLSKAITIIRMLYNVCMKELKGHCLLEYYVPVDHFVYFSHVLRLYYTLRFSLANAPGLVEKEKRKAARQCKGANICIFPGLCHFGDFLKTIALTIRRSERPRAMVEETRNHPEPACYF